MKAIQANPESILDLFRHKTTYIIPNYQRPYTWGITECERLWNDIIEFHEEFGGNNTEGYFLGSITVYKEKEDDVFYVVDGQQRLITLSLLIKALSEKNLTYKGLLHCIRQVDMKTREPMNKARIESRVIESNNEDLVDIIINGNTRKKSRLGDNYLKLKELLDEKLKENTDNPDSYFSALTDTVLKAIKLLRIEAGDQDDAFQIFETINATGTPLNATDIFKARLCGNIKGEEEETRRKDFIDNWKEFKDHADPSFLFAIYMRILRAKDKNRDSTSPKVQSYFLDEQKEKFKEPFKVIEDLNKIKDIADGNFNLSNQTMQWWRVIETLPHVWWQYPLFTFLYKQMKNLPEDGIEWDFAHVEEKFSNLIQETVRYLVIRGIQYRSTNNISAVILNVCVDIANDGDRYIDIYKKGIEDIDHRRFKEAIKEHNSFGRYQKIMVYLNSCLCEIYEAEKEKRESNFYEQIEGSNKINIEHILPKKWNHYDGWNSETHTQNINRMGNLMLLERKPNYRASNEFFQRKKEEYSTSKFTEAELMSQHPAMNWGIEQLDQRDKEIKERLFKFLRMEH